MEPKNKSGKIVKINLPNYIFTFCNVSQDMKKKMQRKKEKAMICELS